MSIGLYINGMEMPQEGFVEVCIRDDGTVQQTGQSYRFDGKDYYMPYFGEIPVIYKAVPVPPHGRLLDIDRPYELKLKLDGSKSSVDLYGIIVIPAEEGET